MKKVIILILSISILMNIILGYRVYSTQNKVNKVYTEVENANELSLYNCCSCLYFVFEDLNDEIFLKNNINQINTEYMQQIISKEVHRLISIQHMIIRLTYDDHIDKKIHSDDIFVVGEYFGSLSGAIKHNVILDNEDISILHQILDEGKMFGLYGESSRNYKKELDPEHPPLDKIGKLYEDLGKLCKEPYEKLESKIDKQK